MAATLPVTGGGAATAEVGDVISVEYDGEPGVFYQRLLLRPDTEGVVKSYMDLDPEPGVPALWVLTPDGDMYPEQIGVPPLLGTVRMTDAGDLVRRVYAFGDESIADLTPKVVVVARESTERETEPCRPAGCPIEGIPGGSSRLPASDSGFV